MRWRLVAGALAIGLALAVLPAVAVAAGAPKWRPGLKVGLPLNAASDPAAALNAVSCARPGTCTAVGTYNADVGGKEVQAGMLVNESAGKWSRAIEVSPPSSGYSFADLVSVSCRLPGKCSAVGSYENASLSSEGWLVRVSGGKVMASAQVKYPVGAATDPSATLGSVSCGSAGNCAAVGSYEDANGASQALVVNQVAGVWKQGVEVIPPQGDPANPKAALTSVACPSMGNCSAAGNYVDNKGTIDGVVLSEVGGAWGAAHEVTPMGGASNPAVFLHSVSCRSAGACEAAGDFTNASGQVVGLVVFESGGSWGGGTAVNPPGEATNPDVNLDSTSCPVGGVCVAVGYFRDQNNYFQGLLVNGSAARTAMPPSGAYSNPEVALNSVSCATAGNCTTVGAYWDANQYSQGMLESEVSGKWQQATEVIPPAGSLANPNVTPAAVSCAIPTICSAVGYYQDKSGHDQALVVSSPLPPPPNTTITDVSINHQARSATFKFAGTGGVGHLRFICKSDGGKFTSCTSPHTYTHLAKGTHTFEVAAVDASGRADPSPAIRHFTI